MSRQSQKRNKFAKKPTALYTTSLETVNEDEELVTTVSTGQAPNALQNSSKRQRKRKAKISAAPSILRLSETQIIDVFKTLWSVIDPKTKTMLTCYLGMFVMPIDRQWSDPRQGALLLIELWFAYTAGDYPLSSEVVSPFRAILRYSPVAYIRVAVEALANMSEDRDTDRPGSQADAMLTIPSDSDSDTTMASTDGSSVAEEDSDEDTSGSHSDAMMTGTCDLDGTMESADGNSSDSSVPDASVF